LVSCGARTSLEAGSSERPSECGNHHVEADEQCDDGNDDSGDACNACHFARCGDGVIYRNVEACDDGNNANDDDCTTRCALASCGNGIIDAGEQCDDGNQDDGDDCPGACLVATCGDGHVWRNNEACDLGPENANRPALEVLQGPLVEPLLPIDGSSSAAAFYAYQSASAHTGLEAVGLSRIYFHRERPSARLSLFIHHGIDIDSSGLQQPKSRVHMSLQFLPPGVVLDLTDDKPEELWLDSPTSARAEWTFNQNTDGGALGSFAFPGNWTVDVNADFLDGVDSWQAFDAAGFDHALKLSETAILHANDERSACRIDCTIPRCGDAILDGGEVCDDGNQNSNDGCSANCTSLD
jgi:cysteine-rich repeat protein